jgi:hypothetical protein
MAQDIAAPLEEEGKVTQAVIQPAISGAEVTRLSMYKASALNELAQGYDTLGRGIESGVNAAMQPIAAGAADNMARQGVIDGAASVTRDANGNIQVQPTTGTLFGLGGSHYSHAVSEGTQQQITANLRSDIDEIAAKNLGNPEGLKAGIAGYLQGHTGALGAGQEGKIALIDAQNYGQQKYDHSLTEKASRDINNAGKALEAGIKSDQADLEALALGGMAGGDEFAKTLGHQTDLYNSLTSNPAFGTNPDAIAVARKDNAFGVTAKTIQGSMATAFQNGGTNAATEVVKSIDDYPGASDADKASLKVSAAAVLKNLQSQNSTAISANKTAFETILKSGVPPPLDVLQDFQNKANYLGDDVTSKAAANEITAHRYATAVSTLSPSQHDAVNGVGKPAPSFVPYGTSAASVPSQPGAIPGQSDPHKPGFDPSSVPYQGKPAASAGVPSGMAAPPTLSLRSSSVDVKDVDPRLLDVVSAGATHLGPGYSVQVNEGYDASGHVVMSQHHVQGKGAIDIQIIGPNGPIPNEGADTTGKYTELAKATYGEMKARHPELDGQLAWGGNFGTVSGGNTPDLMHFDIGGDRGHLGRLSTLAGGGGPAASVDRLTNAFIQQESGGNAKTGNIGQIQPDTWKQYAKPGERIDNPADNKAVTGRILQDYSQKYNGDPGRIAVAYFSGSTNVAPAGSPTPWKADTADASGKHVSSYVQDIAGRLGSGVQTAPNAPASARPISWEDLKNNPGLAPTYASIIAKDGETRANVGSALLESSTRALQNGILPSDETRTQIEQLATPEVMAAKPALAEKYDAYSKEMAAYSLANQGPAPGGGTAPSGQPLIDQARAAAASQPDILQREVVDKAQKLRDESEKLLKENPVAAALNYKAITAPPAPLDPTQPQTIGQHFAGNAAVVDAIRAREPDFSKSVVFKNETDRLGATMAGPAAGGKAVLDALSQLPQDKRDATLQMPAVQAAILGMANSPDAGKKQAAFGFMDNVYRQDPQSFDGKFGKDGLQQMRAWQDVEQYKTPEQIAKDANTANDPSTRRAQEALGNEATKEKLKGVTSTDIANKMAPHWGWGDYTPVSDVPGLTKAVLLDDYSRAYAEQYAKTGDATAADKYATERTAVKWGPSDANGGRVMAFPPERSAAYPMVNGNRNYIGSQLADFATQAGHTGAEAHLVPDATTEAEMSSGKPPGYSVVVQGNDGQYALIPGRFYANPAAAQAQANAQFTPSNSRGGSMLDAIGAVVNPALAAVKSAAQPIISRVEEADRRLAPFFQK